MKRFWHAIDSVVCVISVIIERNCIQNPFVSVKVYIVKVRKYSLPRARRPTLFDPDFLFGRLISYNFTTASFFLHRTP